MDRRSSFASRSFIDTTVWSSSAAAANWTPASAGPGSRTRRLYGTPAEVCVRPPKGALIAGRVRRRVRVWA